MVYFIQKHSMGIWGGCMDFNEHGYLEPGFHDLNINEIRDKFVDRFSNSTTRKDILDGYINYLSDLGSCGVMQAELWIDGSFSTAKENPNDIDMVLVIDKDVLDNIPEDKHDTISVLMDPKQARIKYKCDAYLLVKVDTNHSDYGSYINMRSYWRGWFSFDRKEIPKGIIRMIMTREVG